MFLLRREQGRLAGLAPALRTLVRLNPDGVLWRPGLAALYAELGMLDDADRLLGMLASTAGRPADAERWLARALDLSRRLDSPLWTAHCLYSYATISDPPPGPGPCWPRRASCASGTAWQRWASG